MEVSRDLTTKEQVKQIREKLYQKARNFRINHIMEDLDEYNNDKLYGILNGESKFLWASSKLSDLTGWTIYEIISMPLKRLFHKEDVELVDNLYANKQNVDSVSLRVRSKDGSFRPLTVKCQYNPEKKCVYCYEI